MVNYLSSYIPHIWPQFQSHESPEEGFSISIDRHMRQEFHLLKKAISNDVNLQYFDPQKPVVLQVDASQVGLRAALLQDSKLIAYASKILTPAETRYANRERNVSCSVQMSQVPSLPFICNSDHQHLENIHLKHLNDAPPRFLRFLLKLWPYNVTIKVTKLQLQMHWAEWAQVGWESSRT